MLARRPNAYFTPTQVDRIHHHHHHSPTLFFHPLHLDSVIVLTDRQIDQQLRPLIGDQIGELKEEIPAPLVGLEFAAISPKSYSLRMVNEQTGEEETLLRAKGMKLTTEARRSVRFERFKSMVMAGPNRPEIITVENQPVLRRDIKRAVVRNATITKRMRLIIDKRCLLPDSALTVPFGYHKPADDN